MAKITFVGAGSTVFARNLLGDILGYDELGESEPLAAPARRETTRATLKGRIVLAKNGELVIAVKDHLSDQGKLDALLVQSHAVLGRITSAAAPADRSVS